MWCLPVVIGILVAVLLFVEAKVTTKGEHVVTINGKADEALKISGNPTLLSALASKDIFFALGLRRVRVLRDVQVQGP